MNTHYASDFIHSFIFLFTESAPFLLLGLFIAGIIHTIIPNKWVEKTLGKRNSMVTAAFIGAPIPLCSCSVIPAAMGIRRSGASKASTASFMVATPETGVDSVSVTYALLGPFMAIIRPISAIISAIVTGVLVQWWDKDPAAQPTKTAPTSSCCSQKSEAISASCAQSEQAKSTSCCASKNTKTHNNWLNKLKSSFLYSYGKLLGDFMVWLLIGLVFAALIRAFVPESFLAEHGSGIFSMLVMVLISVPMYICATASTPIAAGLMLSGISPGAALVFMMAGPATNIATIMVIKTELGIRSLYAYLIGVGVSAIALGLITDAIVNAFNIQISVSSGIHGEMTSLLYSASALVLAGLIAWNIYKKYLRNA